MQTAQHPVVSLWMSELILCVTYGLAQLHCRIVPSNRLLNSAGFNQKVLPSAIPNCFLMCCAPLFKRLFSNATGSLFINIRDEGVEGEAENLNSFAKAWLGVSRTHYLREVTALSKG